MRRTLVVTNSGLNDGDTIRLYSIWLSEPDAIHFSTDFVGPVDVEPGDSYSIEVTYSPRHADSHVGSLYLSHNGRSSLDIFTLSGTLSSEKKVFLDASEIDSRIVHGRAKTNFGKSLLTNIGNVRPTSLQFGPDGKLYVADMLGLIYVYEVERDAANKFRVRSTEIISNVRQIANHNDNGKLNASVVGRLVTGITVIGTEQQPVIYVASSDPRIGGGPSATETNLDTNSGVISRLTRSGNGWVKKDLVRGLPRSEENHHPNGILVNTDTNKLYLVTGGNTNSGAPSNNFAFLPEYALSAAVLEVDLDQIGNTTYNLPTLDDETRVNVNGADINDPWGGNDGKNQAKLLANGPVKVYAPGFRNAYDLVQTTSGRMYTFDNGPNAGWGGTPVGVGTQGNCTNAVSEPGKTFPDGLHFISGPGYFGGHAEWCQRCLAHHISRYWGSSADFYKYSDANLHRQFHHCWGFRCVAASLG